MVKRGIAMAEPMAHSVWVHVKNELLESVHAEQALCSIIAEMLLLPQFRSQAGTREVYQENYETSLLRNIAVGHLTRLQAGEPQTRLVPLTVEALATAARHDHRCHSAIRTLTAATPDDQVWLRAANNWREQREYWLHRAAATLKSGIAPDAWEQGINMAR